MQIKSGLSVSNDLEIFTERAFKLAKKWYGLAPGQPEIKRYAHATNPDGPDLNVQYELYPPVFTLRKVHAAGTTFDKHATEDGKQKAPRIVSSRSAVFQSFLKRAKESTGVPMSTKVKLWRELNPESVSTDIKITVTNDGQMPSPPESREPSPNRRTTSQPLLLSAQKFKEMPEAVAREMIDMKDETSNDKYNGSVQLGVLGLGADQVLILEEQASNGTFASDSGKKATKGAKKGGLLSSTSSGRSSPALGPVTRGRNRSSGRTPGSVGLGNLGNTCYMNSALQCLRSTEELTSFFLAKAWKKELNKGNPLGHEGKMATSYASLLDSIYDTNSSSFTPVDFKRTLSKCGPQFSGYGQQDSQEFMSFLVDALHEDMNRIHQKPYIENPDSDDSKVKDEEYIKELGNIFRDNYRKRNDSVIHDLFNGFYKNTMVCPDCDKVSVTFDPYLLLTLQLPLEHSWQHTVYFWPLHGEPVRVEIDMDKHATIKQLKEYVANKVPGLEAKRVMMAEVFGKKFYRTVEDKQTIAEANIQARDDMFLYELDEAPTNFPPPKRKKKSGYRSMLFTNDDDEEADIPGDDSPMAEVMMVPVFQRVKNQYGGGRSLTSTPFFITVNREEAKNYQEIYRKVVARIASITTRDFLHELSLDNENSSENEQDRADEDATSGTEGDVQARSVDSEDGVVEVSVSKQHAAKGATSASQAFPAVLNAGTPMPKALLDLFELNILDKGSEMVPTGFNTVDERRTLKSLRSRTPLLSRRGSVDAATPGSSESSDVDELTTRAQPSFANGAEASEEDDDFVVTKNKKLKTYSKKNRATNGNKSASSEDEEVEHDLDATTDEPILHLGECLVIDWGYDQYDALFEGSSPDDMRGQLRINKDMPLLDDKELKEKRMKRTERKRNGITLDECFKVTAQGEILTEDNAWYCNRCKELRRAEKTLEIWTAPDILCIHLKRFSAARQFRDKIDILVEFPIEGLNLNDKVGLTEDKDLIYDLFAVDNHYGGLGGGHYTAYAKNFVDEQWYEYNGEFTSVVLKVSILTILQTRQCPNASHLLSSLQQPTCSFTAVERQATRSTSEHQSCRSSSRTSANHKTKMPPLPRKTRNLSHAAHPHPAREKASASAGHRSPTGCRALQPVKERVACTAGAEMVRGRRIEEPKRRARGLSGVLMGIRAMMMTRGMEAVSMMMQMMCCLMLSLPSDRICPAIRSHRRMLTPRPSLTRLIRLGASLAYRRRIVLLLILMRTEMQTAWA